MNLKEPKKKKQVRLQAQAPLPVNTNENGKWKIYTAHLSASGTCIVDPAEMEAVYSMGFFGKGSLSRSFPSFGRRRFGAPPIVRNRQWARRQKWLEELQNLNENPDSEESPEMEIVINENLKNEPLAGNSCSEKSKTPISKSAIETTEKSEKVIEETKISESVESPMELEKSSEKTEEENSASEKIREEIKEISNDEEISKTDDNRKLQTQMEIENSTKVDEVILDSTEDEEVCEIVEKISNADNDNVEHSLHDEICVLNDDEQTNEITENYSNYNEDEENESMMEEESNPYEVLVLPDTDSDTENYLKSVESRIEKEGFPINETLHLTFEETFFLMYALGCLQLVHYDGSVFSLSNAWNYFQMQDTFFIQKYVAYHYFRSKGWVVKPGLKYGGDFLLYKQGPPFYHASYIVIVEVIDADTLLRDEVKSMRKLIWKNLIGLERLSETISKEILFAQILWPSSISRNGNAIPAEALSEFTVRELLWRRWDPKRKREIASVDDEESDST